MIKYLASAVVLVFLTQPMMAQDTVEFDIAASEDCFFAADTTMEARQICFGLAAKKCIESNEIADDPTGMTACYSGELAYWNTRLDQNYELFTDFAEAEEMKALETLRKNWAAYRNATCEYEQFLSGENDANGLAWTQCSMKLTAAHSVYLELKTYD